MASEQLTREPSTLESTFPHLRGTDYDKVVNLPNRVGGAQQDKPPIKLSNLILPVFGFGVYAYGRIKDLLIRRQPDNKSTSSPAADTSPEVP